MALLQFIISLIDRVGHDSTLEASCLDYWSGNLDPRSQHGLHLMAGGLRRSKLFRLCYWSLAHDWSVIVPPLVKQALAASLV